MIRLPLLAAVLLAAALPAQTPVVPTPVSNPPAASDYRARLPEDEVIYFLLPDRFENGDPSNDRGGLTGDRLQTGFDPTAKGFYHGGDLRGLLNRLPYIQDLGATAIWVGPIFRNNPVQGPPGQESAGYHGYWITDFTQIDPHLGTNADFKALVDAAHARGMKVYMDIVVNHTADVIRYRDCPGNCPYRGTGDYPFQRRGGVGGAPINPGFAGEGVRTAANFARLTDMNFAYQPYIPAGQEHAKTPDWLNDIRYYHNRGDSNWHGESITHGDFAGLDDIATENPRVVAGFIEVFGGWIDRFGVDGFRIDTAKHVNPEFWQEFVPAMQARARARGIPNFHVFGEVYTEDFDPALLAEHTRTDAMPAVLDYALQNAVTGAVSGRGGEALTRLVAADILYDGGAAAARRLPTFVSNHDVGRLALFIRRRRPTIDDRELLARTVLGHAMLLTLRGVPTIYSGDEQGFVGHGNDQDARQDMFASQVVSYNDQPLLGTATTTATAHFGEDNPLFRAIAALARIRRSTPALTRGRTVIRVEGEAPGLIALSRFDPVSGKEVLVLYNTAAGPVTGRVPVEVRSADWQALVGGCAPHAAAPGSVAVSLPALGYAVCAAR
ncbi:alpha-amylase family glycosyl hydrolase [Sphingomonas sp.]|uniref:alpha-amylase family glycosyl hydrolase n=1 Tax=Sphingomonas sp. TaxID=28214 RepID=UPI003CC664BF